MLRLGSNAGLPFWGIRGQGTIARVGEEVFFFDVAAFGFDLGAELAEGLEEGGGGGIGVTAEEEVDEVQDFLEEGFGEEFEAIEDLLMGGIHGGGVFGGFCGRSGGDLCHGSGSGVWLVEVVEEL
jgi:hypothetical protein